MINILLTVLILLVHTESNDVEIVESCEYKGDSILVNMGFGIESFVEFPSDSYECFAVKRLSK